MISYIPLQHTLLNKGITKKELQEALHLGPNTLSKISKNENVSLGTLDKICTYLDCSLQDVVEHIKE